MAKLSAIQKISRVGGMVSNLGRGSIGVLFGSLAAYTGWNVLAKGKGLDETVVRVIHGEETREKYVEQGGIAVWDRLVNGKKAEKSQPTPQQSPYQSEQEPVQAVSPMQSSDSLFPGLGSFSSTINGFLGNLSSGRLNMMNTVSLIAGAYLLFGGRFGWLGKIAGLILGGFGLKNIFGQQVSAQPRLSPQPVTEYVPVAPDLTQEEQNDNHVVSRNR